MMQANELRIGNYVNADLYNDKYILIESICSKNEDVFNSESGEIPLISLNPIALTEDILLKCGFEYSTMGIYKKSNLYLIKWSDENAEFNVFGANGIKLIKVEIKSIHQLQNLYFALTNKELEINL
jgi:hypothetical protein